MTTIRHLPELIAHSTIRQSKTRDDVALNESDQYLLGLLSETCREIRFYHQLVESGSKEETDRLQRSLKALAETYKHAPKHVSKTFYDIMADDGECFHLIKYFLNNELPDKI